MREIVGNSEELFLGKREHGAQFLGTWELSKVNFWEHLNLFLRNKGKTVNFYREQKNIPPPPRPSLEALYIRLDAIREPLNLLKTNLHFYVKGLDLVLILTHNV